MAFSSFIRKLEGKSQPTIPEKIFPYPGALALWNGRRVILMKVLPETPDDPYVYWEFYDDFLDHPLFTISHPGVAWEHDFVERKY